MKDSIIMVKEEIIQKLLMDLNKLHPTKEHMDLPLQIRKISGRIDFDYKPILNEMIQNGFINRVDSLNNFRITEIGKKAINN